MLVKLATRRADTTSIVRRAPGRDVACMTHLRGNEWPRGGEASSPGGGNSMPATPARLRVYHSRRVRLVRQPIPGRPPAHFTGEKRPTLCGGAGESPLAH